MELKLKKQDYYVLTNEDSKIMGIVKGTNEDSLASICKAIKREYDVDDVEVTDVRVTEWYDVLVDIKINDDDNGCYEETFTLTISEVY